MKKAVILFVVFAFLDFILYVILGNFSGASQGFETQLLPFIVIEIATYGSIIVYDIEKKDKKDN